MGVGAMLHPFVSARPRHVGRPSVLLLSITAHVIFIYALFSQRVAIQYAGGDIARTLAPPLERIRFFQMAPVPTAPETTEPTSDLEVPPSITLPRLVMPTINPISIAAPSTAMPDVDLTVKIADADTAAIVAGPKVTELVKGLVSEAAVAVGTHNGPFLKSQVDKVVMPFGNNPKPVYPWALQRQGVETSFVAQFVVDSTGRVDEKSLLFPPDANGQFVESVRRALRRSKYYPAEIGGQRVPQLVEQRFSFVLVQGRGGL
jgi:hypothetical protein